MFKQNFSQQELNEARQNGFILTGKAGTGKSTLLNVIIGRDVAVAKKSALAVTKETEVYYLKLKNGKCFSIVDTPGLSDPDIISDNKADLDRIHLKEIEKKISEEKIHIKGILFLVNFQIERFDSSEQEALINYNSIFPLRRFWKHLIVIFTHDFADPNGDSVEEMREMRDESNGQIFSKLMERVKDVSDVITYKELRIKYYNSYSPVKNNKQKMQNQKNKEDLEKLFNELIQKDPLFCQIEIMHVKNEKEKINGKTYLVEYEKIGFFDFNHAPLFENRKYIKKEEIHEKSPVKPSYTGYVYSPPPPPKPNQPITPPKPEVADPNNSNYLKYKSEIGAGVGAVGGAALGALGGLAYAGGITAGGIGLGSAIAAGAAATASVFAAPVAIGIGVVGAIGAGAGYLISKLFK